MSDQENNTNEFAEPEKSVEQKLGDLMMQGWTMLADACFKDSCQTPLMRDNVTKQIYCVGCEAWVCTENRTHKEYKFRQLVPIEGRRNVQVKEQKGFTEVSKIPKKKVETSVNPFVQVLENKLMTFSLWLEKEQDVKKCNEILDAMKKTIDILKSLNVHISK